MKASIKKILLDELNKGLNKALDDAGIPPAIMEYARQEILTKDHYGWYMHNPDQRITGSVLYCAACRTESNTYKLRHKTKEHCPKCGNLLDVRLKDRSKEYRAWNKDYVCYFQTFGDAIVVRSFDNSRYYSDHKHRDGPGPLEYQRWIMRQGSVRSFLSYYGGGWHQQNSVGIHILNYHVFNTREELRKLFKGTFCQSSPWLDLLPKEQRSINIWPLYKWVTWPSLEYLYKLGYLTLVTEIIEGRRRGDMSLNLYARKANSVLGVSHSILQKYNHKTLRECDIKAIKQLIAFGKLGQLTPERMKFISGILTNNSLDPLEVFRSFGIEKVLNYIAKQVAVAEQINAKAGCMHGRRAVDVNTAWHDFQDYRGECHKLGYDLTDEGIMFPKDLYAAHTRTSQLVREQQEEIRKKELALQRSEIEASFAKAVKPFLKQEFSDGKFLFRVCRAPDELYEESAKLKHCVSSYDKRVAAKTCLIFFIRSVSDPDKPFYTLEYNPRANNIVQLRGFSNKTASPDIHSFAENCVKRLKNKAAGGAL